MIPFWPKKVKSVCFLQVVDAFGAHVEEQVENGEVGQEPVLLLVDLIVGTGLKVGIGQRVFGADGVAKVVGRW